MPVTLRHLAASAGVSATTVSLCLRNHPRIPLPTRRKIQELAKEMGYRPDPYVSVLMAQKRAARPIQYQATLGFLTAWGTADGWKSNSFCRKCFNGAKARAEELGFLLEPFWIASPEFSLPRWDQIFRTRNITGVILAPLEVVGEFPALCWENYSVAAIGNTVVAPKVSRVSPHQFHVMTLALRKVADRGYQRVGLLLRRWVDEKVDHTWSSAYLGWQELHPKNDRIPIFWADDFENLSEGVREWLKKHQPDVVLGYGEASRILREAGVTIPRDVAFVHLDVDGKVRQLAGVDQCSSDVGRGAVDLLVAQIHRSERGLPTVAKTMMIEGRWVDAPSLPDSKSKPIKERNATKKQSTSPVRKRKMHT